MANGYQEGHLTVKVVVEYLNYATHQIIRSNDKSSTTIRRAGKVNADAIKNDIVVLEARIDFSDAHAALDFQKEIKMQNFGNTI